MQTVEYNDTEMAAWLDTTDHERLSELYQQAYAIKTQCVGTKVYYRGLIEFSNICAKDCLYCGIRRSNDKVDRYDIPDDEIVEAARWAHQQRYGSIVLQGGERSTPAFTTRIENLLQRIHRETGNDLGITLSLGEQPRATYQRWLAAGAKRYLLRIETSNPTLYAAIHPPDHNFEERVACLRTLQELGWQTGTGVMIGIPGQTTADLVQDIRFFQKMDIDMIGMGPYIPHDQTPLAQLTAHFDGTRQLQRALTMIALTRITLRDVNIAAATALQALDPQGRERGLEVGANIIMPNLTETRYRTGYQLYNGKPCMDENAGMCRFCLAGRIASVGESIGYGEHGDAPHFARRKAQATDAKPRTKNQELRTNRT
ncbi:MAG: [FeFe] hydrogenase H-cluster radical SAM maturase HydE [Kiritimatiellia bacterium]